VAVETVKIYVKDQDDLPIVDVLVRVFDETGTTFISQNYTTLVSGRAEAEFTLDGDDPPISYTIRLSKTGVAFDGNQGDASKTPQLITIYSPPTAAPNGTNNFEVIGQTFTLPTATDPRLCRASGFFKDPTGQPLAGLEMEFINQFRPAVVDGYGVLGAKVDVRTDEDGYVEIDLYRFAEYHVMIQGLETAEECDTGAIVFDRDIVVPDRASMSLLDLLFPVVASIDWGLTAVSVAEGESLDIFPSLTATDYRELTGSANEDVIYSVEDEEIASVSASEDRVTVVGKAAGITNLIATRKDQSIVIIPAAEISGQPIEITVT